VVVSACLAQDLELHLADHVLVLVDQDEIGRDAFARAGPLRGSACASSCRIALLSLLSRMVSFEPCLSPTLPQARPRRGPA
jgi:hypothetical protein